MESGTYNTFLPMGTYIYLHSLFSSYSLYQFFLFSFRLFMLSSFAFLNIPPPYCIHHVLYPLSAMYSYIKLTYLITPNFKAWYQSYTLAMKISELIISWKMGGIIILRHSVCKGKRGVAWTLSSSQCPYTFGKYCDSFDFAWEEMNQNSIY